MNTKAVSYTKLGQSLSSGAHAQESAEAAFGRRFKAFAYVIAGSAALLSSGCTWSSLFASKQGLGKGPLTTISHVKTTAYTHSESSHRRYGTGNAIGTKLQSGKVYSASADWSRYPVGTRFKIKQTGCEYVVDDYGSALVGTNTIDLYKPTMSEMRNWGLKYVDIEVLEWGSFEKSLDILEDRQRNRHVRLMVASLKQKQAALASGGHTGSRQKTAQQL